MLLGTKLLLILTWVLKRDSVLEIVLQSQCQEISPFAFAVASDPLTLQTQVASTPRMGTPELHELSRLTHPDGEEASVEPEFGFIAAICLPLRFPSPAARISLIPPSCRNPHGPA